MDQYFNATSIHVIRFGVGEDLKLSWDYSHNVQ